MCKRHSAWAVVRAAAALEAVKNVVLLHIFEVALLEVRVHVNGLKSHGAYGDALAAAYAGGIFDVSVFFLSEEQNACRTLDVDSVDIGSDKAHHRSAENYLLRGLDEAAALLDNVTEGYRAC